MFKASRTGRTSRRGDSEVHKICVNLRLFYKRNIIHLPCLHSLMQTLEWVWENSKVCLNLSRRGQCQHVLRPTGPCKSWQASSTTPMSKTKIWRSPNRSVRHDDAIAILKTLCRWQKPVRARSSPKEQRDWCQSWWVRSTLMRLGERILSSVAGKPVVT